LAAIEAALRWIDGPGDPTRTVVEYQRATEQGLRTRLEGSFDAIFHADGNSPKAISALAEFRDCLAGNGWRRAAPAAGLIEQAAQLESAALLLADRFEQAFWCGSSAPTRWRSTAPSAVQGANSMPAVLHRTCGRACAGVAADLMSQKFFRMGIRTSRAAKPLQPDVLSRWIDLAA